MVWATIIGAGAEVLGRFQAQAANNRIRRDNRAMIRRQAAVTDNLLKAQQAKVQATGARVIAQQRAAFAGQGVSVQFGTPQVLRFDTERAVLEDVRTIRNNADLAAWGYDNDLENLRLEEQLETQRTQFEIAGTILGAATDIQTIKALRRQ
jgi:hypothetical protein